MDKPINKTNYTPAPWVVDDHGDDKFGKTVYVSAEHGNAICQVVRDGDFRELANANLIAAAPELLLSLSVLLFTIHSNKRIYWNNALHTAVHEAESAIAKAQGKPT